MTTTPPDPAATTRSRGGQATHATPVDGTGTPGGERTFVRRPSWRSRTCFSTTRPDTPVVAEPRRT